MKFVLVDRIVALESGRRIVTEKALSLAEEYLADHFPAFPVLPGVLMLEAMVQSSAWLVREAQDFAPALVVLKDARNVTYKSFLVPGQKLTVESNCKELGDEQSVFAAAGMVDGREVVKAKLTLRHLSATAAGGGPQLDDHLRREQRRLFGLLTAGLREADATLREPA